MTLLRNKYRFGGNIKINLKVIYRSSVIFSNRNTSDLFSTFAYQQFYQQTRLKAAERRESHGTERTLGGTVGGR